MLRRLVGLLIALVATFLTAPLQSEAAAPVMLTATYSYGGHQTAVAWTDTATERGPRADAFADTATCDAADHRSRGAVARLDETTPGTTTVYTASADVAHFAGSTATTEWPPVVARTAPCSISPRQVAANADIGLSGRGLVPAAGTRIRPAGIPEGWRITGTKSSGGVLYRDPTNAGNSVRVMQGSPNSPFPNSQAPYVRWQRNGQPLDQFGNHLPLAKVPEAHIPLDDFQFLPEVFK